MKFPLPQLSADFGLFLLRVSAGALMLTHGYPKLNLLLNDDPLKFPDPIGLGSTLSLVLAVGAEVVAATLLVLGVKTRFMAVPLAITMAVACFVVHAADAFAKKEMALLYLISYVILLLCGGGKYQLKA